MGGWGGGSGALSAGASLTGVGAGQGGGSGTLTVSLDSEFVGYERLEAAASVQRIGTDPQREALAVGEVGLDYFFRPGYLETPVELQRQVFAAMLELAKELGKPVVIHQRQAQADLLELLDRGPTVTGILHCFSGGAEFAAEASARGLYCSFAGNATFKSAHDLRAAARAVPGGLLLVETDAPFMAPEPHRGQTCEPAMVRATAQWVAALRGDCLESLAESSTANARSALGVPRP